MILKQLKMLCAPEGVSGCERAATEAFRSLVAPFSSKCEYDKAGNFYAYRLCGKENAPLIMLEAHADKIGLMVRHITREGFVLFSEIGGFDPKVLPSSNVIIYGREKVFGVVSVTPPHVKKGDEKTVTPSDELFIDTGFPYDEITKKISVGDFIEIDTCFTNLIDNMAASPALDDRAGLLVLARVMELMDGEDLSFDICAAATVQEEVGCRGAVSAALHVNPFISLCVDVCHARTPDASENVFDAGCGPVITVGPNIARPVSDALIGCARENSIPYKIDVDAGNTGTNAWEIQVAGEGVFTGLISLPVRYMHTPFEVMDTNDIESCAQLIKCFIKTVKGDEICY